MGKFYAKLWSAWVIRVTLCSIMLAIIISSGITLYVYINQAQVELNNEVFYALYKIFIFNFSLVWNITFLIALFRSVKYIFNKNYNGYFYKLSECDTKESIEIVGYGDLVRVWRRWFMILIWFVVVEMILATFLLYIFYDGSVYLWFNVYWIYGATMISGYVSLVLLPNRCKRVRLAK